MSSDGGGTDWQALWSSSDVRRLAEALARDFDTDAVASVLGLAGEAALSRGDLCGAERLTRGGSDTETWIRLFLLGEAVPEHRARSALRPFTLESALEGGLVERVNGEEFRAAMDVRPYAETNGPQWWVLSDLGPELRPGPLDGDYVLGVGAASTTLAQCTIRTPAARALDIGTGCGIQALHLSRHCRSVTATDVSARALRMAATTAALNGLDWELRQGSLTDPVAGRTFDRVVCNPPFIVSPGYRAGEGGYTYRDSGMAGDAVSRELLRGLPAVLDEGGTAQLLANWAITAREDWAERVGGWLEGSDCDAWIWQREVAEPGEYVSLWLRDSGLSPGSSQWRIRYDEWLDWFAAEGILAVGMGLVNLRRSGSATPTVRCEDVPQPIEQPSGHAVDSWFARSEWLAAQSDERLLSAALQAGGDLVLEERSTLDASGWDSAWMQLRQASGMRWEVEVDADLAGLVSACRGGVDLRTICQVIAARHEVRLADVTAAVAPVVRDLVHRGMLAPAELAISSAGARDR